VGCLSSNSNYKYEFETSSTHTSGAQAASSVVMPSENDQTVWTWAVWGAVNV
jgi:hypothetical protein